MANNNTKHPNATVPEGKAVIGAGHATSQVIPGQLGSNAVAPLSSSVVGWSERNLRKP